jgi:cobalt-precorrin 5A hydrolase/precorrin-3B C17-methyltransferase
MALTGPAIVVLTASALDSARRAAVALDGAEIHGLDGRVDGCHQSFTDAGEHLRALFVAGRPIVAVFSLGALVRLLAPVLGDKRSDPPVIALSEDGAHVIPVLGGHHGANDLARRIADALGGTAAVTTAGDLRFGVALDAPPAGWVLADPGAAKAVMADLLAGASIRLVGSAPWLEVSGLPIAADGAVTITVTEKARRPGPRELVYHPKSLAVGVGCERGCPPDELVAHVGQTLADADLAPQSVAVVVSLDLKADEPAVHAVAEALGAPARFYSAAALEVETPRLANPSDAVFAEVGCHGVAEGAALAATGPNGALVVPKVKSQRATCAIAISPQPVDPAIVGQARGHLAVVGIGPGSEVWRSPEAAALIGAADDLVGYSLYLDLVADLARGKIRHDFPLGGEEERVRHALELAGEGRAVALVCSGDAGIYAMAALVYELLDRNEGGVSDAARRATVTVAPGISALQAAAARAGAPLGHDFCAISLSDLLTPWDVIERRVRAAADGDFVVAFYNPVSMRRRTQLVRAREILLTRRPPPTPVILAANLGRPGETRRIVTLGDLDVGQVDMLTVVIVGSSETRVLRRGDGIDYVYTPRGYAAKADRELAS